MPSPRTANSASTTTVTGSLSRDSRIAAAWSNAADAAGLAARVGPFFKEMVGGASAPSRSGASSGSVASSGSGNSRNMTQPGIISSSMTAAPANRRRSSSGSSSSFRCRCCRRARLAVRDLEACREPKANSVVKALRDMPGASTSHERGSIAGKGTRAAAGPPDGRGRRRERTGRGNSRAERSERHGTPFAPRRAIVAMANGSIMHRWLQRSPRECSIPRAR